MLAQTKALPKILTFNELKYYIFSASFVGLAVFAPWLAHRFHLAGPKFLPMHFFVLIAGLLFGWRAGMMVGVVSPMLSYSITHLPPLAILPETMLELAVYGFVAGVLRKKNLNIWVSLLGAMALGGLARLALARDVSFIQVSWPGTLLQLALIPLIIYFLQKFVFKRI